MNLSLEQVITTDKLKLPALLYTPDKPTKKAAVWLHGMGDKGVFYSVTRTNALGKALTDAGISLLTFNNRGAHNAKTLSVADSEEQYQGGTYYELIKDCTMDIDGAVALLKQIKYTELYLVGHSTGANKVCVYDHHTKQTPFSKYVLAGAGDDTGLHYEELGEATFRKALTTSGTLIAEGKGASTMPEATGMHPFSAQSAFDILNPNGDYNTFPFYEQATKRLGTKQLFREYRGIRIPTLVVYGENDQSVRTAGSVSDALINLEDNTHQSIVDDSGFLTIANTDHGFHGAETQFASAVAAWLSGGAA